jgi:predicted GH43/DUF377 family glycosyl hydrolase
MGLPDLNIIHLSQRFVSDDKRVITRFYNPGGETRVHSVLARVSNLDSNQVEHTLTAVLRRYNQRHRDIGNVFQENFNRLAVDHRLPNTLSRARQLLVGAYFTSEYSVESAALFNPSIVQAPHQDDLPPGAQRFYLSLRATGEGHISSIVFRTGVINADGGMQFDKPNPFTHRIKPLLNQQFTRQWLQRTLVEMESYNPFAISIIDRLADVFTLHGLSEEINWLRDHVEPSLFSDETADRILWACQSNYVLEVPQEADPSEIVIFPTTENESHGIEDARLVQFYNDDQSCCYYGTFTAFDGFRVQSQLLKTTDFRRINISTLQGSYAQSKGLALFPRKISGLYVMLARVDGENNYIMCSPDITLWENASLLQQPQYPWEFMQIGNCGSPLETDKGWLFLTHGVGPMREYCIGVSLLDRDDPTRVIGQLSEPIIVPKEDEREGYVPNVVYSCGALIHNGRLVIPYATADKFTTFASVSVDDLLAHLLA